MCFVGDESGLHLGIVVVDYNTLNLYLVDKNLVLFFESFAVNIIGFRGF